jgi:hypothetical protein
MMEVILGAQGIDPLRLVGAKCLLNLGVSLIVGGKDEISLLNIVINNIVYLNLIKCELHCKVYFSRNTSHLMEEALT